MKVKELIKQLKKMPQNLDVYQADHDHGLYETASGSNQVLLIDKDKMNDCENDKGDGNWNGGVDMTFQTTPRQYVCIRP